ncbi:MAG: MFS transporter [Quisquiliibacterium sp.]
MNETSKQASATSGQTIEELQDSRVAWLRLAASLVLMTIGGCGMYAVVVVLPSVQSEFGVDRADASMPYTLTMIGFGLGGMLMGRLADRFGVVIPIVIGAVCLGAGFVAASLGDSIWQFALLQGLVIGMLGSSATFAPLVADASLWFTRRRGIAVAICASGNYLGGAVWPPIVQHLVETIGWRQAYATIGIASTLLMLPLAMALRRRPPSQATLAPAGDTAAAPAPGSPRPAIAVTPNGIPGISRGALQTLLCIAGVSCCVAMSMPQVHIVAYCGDLGYGAARGAQMLSLMLGAGIVSRLISGVICDRIGGLRTLLLGSALQGIALLLFLPFDSLASLYVISTLFGLFQGGIVPAYAIIVREHFPAREAGSRVGVVLTSTLLGMALGGWLSGKIFDLTGSYDAAFVNGIAWNLVNVGIVLFLLSRARRAMRPAPLAAG